MKNDNIYNSTKIISYYVTNVCTQIQIPYYSVKSYKRQISSFTKISDYFDHCNVVWLVNNLLWLEDFVPHSMNCPNSNHLWHWLNETQGWLISCWLISLILFQITFLWHWFWKDDNQHQGSQPERSAVFQSAHSVICFCTDSNMASFTDHYLSTFSGDVQRNRSQCLSVDSCKLAYFMHSCYHAAMSTTSCFSQVHFFLLFFKFQMHNHSLTVGLLLGI